MSLTMGLILSAGAYQAKPPISGAQVYKAKCAVCHGAKGEGTKIYGKALEGNRSVGELTRYISTSMPPGPKHCPAPEAAQVGKYLFDEFYSLVAQERRRPARVALSRLTVRQFRYAITDLIGSFRSESKIDYKRGLRAEYYRVSRLNGGDRVKERVDPQVQFDYSDKTPLPEQTDPYQFAMQWNGSVIAPDTGEYEFVVRSDQAVQLFVNGSRKPLIDALIKSGSDNEYRGSIYLLSGRAYPIHLIFNKGVTGVDNIAKLKQKPAQKAFITLAWRRPKETEEVIPARCLSPVSVNESYTVSTNFPPDDRSIGYERGTSVDKDWDEAATTSALQVAAFVTDHIREFTGVAENSPEIGAKAKKFCIQFVERAFRRPLTPEQSEAYIEKQFRSDDIPGSMKRVVVFALISPRFLYREIAGAKSDQFDVASKISFALWDTMPDRELMRAAGAGELANRDQIGKQTTRMVVDARTVAKIDEFFWLWLKVDSHPDLAKDSKKYPEMTETVRTDLRTSMQLFLDNLITSDKPDYRQLFLSDKVFVNKRLAPIYGVDIPSDPDFQAVKLDEGSRCGILTHPYILSTFSYIDRTSPIHRGVLIVRNFMGRLLLPPPVAVAPFAEAIHPNLTTRQRVAFQTKPAACAGCHSIINPLGFTLESYDTIGRLRKTENNQPIDCSGKYAPRTGPTVTFTGPKDLANYIANSPDSHATFVEKLFQFMVKQPIRAYGPQTLNKLIKSFEENDCDIRKLIVDIVATVTVKN